MYKQNLNGDQKLDDILRRHTNDRHAPDKRGEHSICRGSSVVYHFGEMREADNGVVEGIRKSG
jgi:hypothetical protein